MDTIVQECIKCGYETDCIDGLCQECYLGLVQKATELTEGINHAYEQTSVDGQITFHDLR